MKKTFNFIIDLFLSGFFFVLAITIPVGILIGLMKLYEINPIMWNWIYFVIFFTLTCFWVYCSFTDEIQSFRRFLFSKIKRS